MNIDKRKSNYDALQSNISAEIVDVRSVAKVTKGNPRLSLSCLGIISDTSKGYAVLLHKTKHLKQAHTYMTTNGGKHITQAIISKNKSLFVDQTIKYRNLIIVAKRRKNGTGITCANVFRPLIKATGIENINIKVYAKNASKVNMIFALKKVIDNNNKLSESQVRRKRQISFNK